MSKFYKLPVKEIKEENGNSVCIVFDIPADLKEEFNFIPGQYLTVKKEIGGIELRRAYSICSSNKASDISIGVKAVPEGSFSVYATQELKAGDNLEIAPPEGRFTLQPSPGSKKNYLAFAAGSGITPVLSMIGSLLESEDDSNFVLVYSNRSPSDTMFQKEIAGFESQFPARFKVHYIYSRVNEPSALFGRIDRSVVNFVLKNQYADTVFDEFFLCGPEPMIYLVKEILIEKGFQENTIKFELFSSPVDEEVNHENLEGKSLLTVVLDEEEVTLTMDVKKSILEVALDHGLDAPYSCQGGICSSCLAQISEGSAVMDKNTILTDSEVEEGLILTCQAHPTSEKITIDYDAV